MSNNTYLYKDEINDSDVASYLAEFLKSVTVSRLPGLEKEAVGLNTLIQSIEEKLNHGETLTQDEARQLSEMLRNLIFLNFAPHTDSINTKGLETYRALLKQKYNI